MDLSNFINKIVKFKQRPHFYNGFYKTKNDHLIVQK
jgi:hypothetical protein